MESEVFAAQFSKLFKEFVDQQQQFQNTLLSALDKDGKPKKNAFTAIKDSLGLPTDSNTQPRVVKPKPKSVTIESFSDKALDQLGMAFAKSFKGEIKNIYQRKEQDETKTKGLIDYVLDGLKLAFIPITAALNTLSGFLSNLNFQDLFKLLGKGIKPPIILPGGGKGSPIPPVIPGGSGRSIPKGGPISPKAPLKGFGILGLGVGGIIDEDDPRAQNLKTEKEIYDPEGTARVKEMEEILANKRELTPDERLEEENQKLWNEELKLNKKERDKGVFGFLDNIFNREKVEEPEMLGPYDPNRRTFVGKGMPLKEIYSGKKFIQLPDGSYLEIGPDTFPLEGPTQFEGPPIPDDSPVIDPKAKKPLIPYVRGYTGDFQPHFEETFDPLKGASSGYPANYAGIAYGIVTPKDAVESYPLMEDSGTINKKQYQKGRDIDEAAEFVGPPQPLPELPWQDLPPVWDDPDAFVGPPQPLPELPWQDLPPVWEENTQKGKSAIPNIPGDTPPEISSLPAGFEMYQPEKDTYYFKADEEIYPANDLTDKVSKLMAEGKLPMGNPSHYEGTYTTYDNGKSELVVEKIDKTNQLLTDLSQSLNERMMNNNPNNINVQSNPVTNNTIITPGSSVKGLRQNVPNSINGGYE